MALHGNKNRPEMPERNPYDFYPTPRLATVALIRHLQIPIEKKIWEPACGEGHISTVLEAFGYSVFSSDIQQECYGQWGYNYLQFHRTLWPVMITNPPYEKAEWFIRKSSELGFDLFAMLLKSNFFHTAKKAKLFNEVPPSWFLPVSWPLNFNPEKGHAALLDFSWVVWEAGVTETKFHVLRKPSEVKSINGEEE